MFTAVSAAEIIILSDDDQEDVKTDGSVLFVEVEDVQKNDSVLCPSAVDEDLVVTFSRRADLLPHARYDCPLHAFTATETEVTAPVDSNQLICEQCFCYVCDKLASACDVWSCSGVCHCNSHNKSNFWNDLRNRSLLGGLQTFNLTLSEMDTNLRRAEMLLENFKKELFVKFSVYLNGKPAEQYGIKSQGVVHDYSPVFECVSSFLNLAEEQDGRAAAIMKLGAAADFVRHFPLSGVVQLQTPMANAAEARLTLMNRVVSSLQRQIIRGELQAEFIHKLQEFYKKLSFPAQLKSLKNSLCVRLWEDVLLVSVLKGQNVSGVRKDKGKKDVLTEQISVVLLRMELLQEQRRYRELCRYLRVVQTDDPKTFRQVLDLMPYFLCLDGNFSSALQTLSSGPSSRLTPDLFLLFFKIFQNGKAPVQVVGPGSELSFPRVPWEPITGAVRLKRLELVKFALRVQSYSSAVSDDAQCWSAVLSLVSSPHGSHCGLPEPSLDFLQESKAVVRSILLSQNSINFHIPRHFQEVYPDQALLLLLTGALSLRILKGPLSPVLPVLRCFQKNVWALRCLWDDLSLSERLSSFTHQLSQETNSTDESIDFLQTVIPFSFSSLRHLDHTYCSPAQKRTLHILNES